MQKDSIEAMHQIEILWYRKLVFRASPELSEILLPRLLLLLLRYWLQWRYHRKLFQGHYNVSRDLVLRCHYWCHGSHPKDDPNSSSFITRQSLSLSLSAARQMLSSSQTRLRIIKNLNLLSLHKPTNSAATDWQTHSSTHLETCVRIQ